MRADRRPPGLFIFRLPPFWLSGLVGIAGILAWLLAVMFAVLGGLQNNYFPVTTKQPDGLYCRESTWVAMWDQGSRLVLFHRFLFIDHTVYVVSWSDSSDAFGRRLIDLSIPPTFAPAVASCHEAVLRAHEPEWK